MSEARLAYPVREAGLSRSRWYVADLDLVRDVDPTIARSFAALTDAAEADERFGADRAFVDLSAHMLRRR